MWKSTIKYLVVAFLCSILIISKTFGQGIPMKLYLPALKKSLPDTAFMFREIIKKDTVSETTIKYLGRVKSYSGVILKIVTMSSIYGGSKENKRTASRLLFLIA